MVTGVLHAATGEFRYSSRAVAALAGVELVVRSGEFITITGPTVT